MADSEKTDIRHEDLDDILNNAIDLTDGDTNYITNMRLRMSNNEMSIDLYRVVADPKNPERSVAYLVHRIVIPPSLAKSSATLMSNLVEGWEETFGISLPLRPIQIEVEDDDT